jgi:hypothetical protein
MRNRTVQFIIEAALFGFSVAAAVYFFGHNPIIIGILAYMAVRMEYNRQEQMSLNHALAKYIMSRLEK